MGDLSANDHLAIVETVVRYAVANARPPCANYGSRAAYCLKVGSGPEVSPRLLRNLSDMQPPILPLTACRTAGFVGERENATDPIIRVEWLRVISDSAVQARVIAYCGASEPIVQRRGRRWLIEESGWIESCLLSGDCVR